MLCLSFPRNESRKRPCQRSDRVSGLFGEPRGHPVDAHVHSSAPHIVPPLCDKLRHCDILFLFLSCLLLSVVF